jgi:ceramide glucosyltransferase
MRDALLPAIWGGAWLRSAIVWRGNAMTIRPKEAGRLRPRMKAA